MNIYTKHFNLNLLPFENVPDPLFFYDHGDHALIRKHIAGSLHSGRGLIVVIGPIGSGKTTLSQMIKSDFPENIKVIWMGEPPTNSTNLYLFLAQELGLQPSSGEKTFVLRDIRQALLALQANGKKCLVIMDESHLMTDDVINGIRLLNNLEEGPSKLMQMLLLGQEELMVTINRPDMEAFKQRIATLEILGKMNADTLRRYVSHRLQVAGGRSALISETGWEALSIAFGGGGTPRQINSLCDRSFGVAFERKKPAVDALDVYEATQRMGLITDVFHYICLLNTRERELKSRESPSVAEHGSSGTVNGFPGIASAAKGAADMPAAQRKSLKMPLVLLWLSIAAFALSVSFFCHRTPGSSGLLDCFIKFPCWFEASPFREICSMWATML
ncbi:MAG: ExeA family protein [Methylobacter sp.]